MLRLVLSKETTQHRDGPAECLCACSWPHQSSARSGPAASGWGCPTRWSRAAPCCTPQRQPTTQKRGWAKRRRHIRGGRQQQGCGNKEQQLVGLAGLHLQGALTPTAAASGTTTPALAPPPPPAAAASQRTCTVPPFPPQNGGSFSSPRTAQHPGPRLHATSQHLSSAYVWLASPKACLCCLLLPPAHAGKRRRGRRQRRRRRRRRAAPEKAGPRATSSCATARARLS